MVPSEMSLISSAKDRGVSWQSRMEAALMFLRAAVTSPVSQLAAICGSAPALITVSKNSAVWKGEGGSWRVQGKKGEGVGDGDRGHTGAR